ncbi:hypothetical protein FB451DRAFT_1161886 [Mycena latifolia]|nr:hypothetical protein FB451DRAFT_1161886 [Mycena latifolia]
MRPRRVLIEEWFLWPLGSNSRALASLRVIYIARRGLIDSLNFYCQLLSYIVCVQGAETQLRLGIIPLSLPTRSCSSRVFKVAHHITLPPRTSLLEYDSTLLPACAQAVPRDPPLPTPQHWTARRICCATRRQFSVDENATISFTNNVRTCCDSMKIITRGNRDAAVEEREKSTQFPSRTRSEHARRASLNKSARVVYKLRMLSRFLTPLASRQLLRHDGARWRRAISSYSPDQPGRRRLTRAKNSQRPPSRTYYDSRIMWDGPGGVSRSPAASNSRPDPLISGETTPTVCIHNVPPRALIREVLDLVLVGPIYHIDDSVKNGSRVVTVTFYDHDTALAFYREATQHKMDLYGHSIGVSWGSGPELLRHPTSKVSRAMAMPPEGAVDEYLPLLEYGPIDRIQVVNLRGKPFRTYINFLSVESCRQAVQDLSASGLDVTHSPDRCWEAGNARAEALKSCSRHIVLRGMPPQTSVADLCDQIRGGALEKINLVPQSGVAFLYFLYHSGAASFFSYAVYRGLVVHDTRLSVQFGVRCPDMPKFLVDRVQRGASRCLRLPGVLDPDVVQNLCDSHKLVLERISKSESNTIVSFTHVRHALTALPFLAKAGGYKERDVEFVPDPCAAPFPAQVEEAVALQAEIASLLIPPEAKQSSDVASDGVPTPPATALRRSRWRTRFAGSPADKSDARRDKSGRTTEEKGETAAGAVWGSWALPGILRGEAGAGVGSGGSADMPAKDLRLTHRTSIPSIPVSPSTHADRRQRIPNLLEWHQCLGEFWGLFG